MQAAAGRALNTLPDALGVTDPDERTCCATAGCFGLCYAMDLCCTIPTMSANEVGEDQYSLPLFAFYECCWPCMRMLQYLCCLSREDRVSLRAKAWPPYYLNPPWHH